MKIYVLFLFLNLFLWPVSFLAQPTVVTVDPAAIKQTIVGLGANIDCDSAVLYEIGASMIRIGRDDTGAEPVNDNGDPFVLDLAKFNGLDAQTIQKVKDLYQRRGVKVIYVVSTPPVWMKDTNSPKMYWRILESSGAPASQVAAYRYRYECGGELRADMYPEFGEFVAGILLKFREQTGFDVYSVCPQNEPEFAEPYWSCVYTSTQIINATNAIGEQLKRYNLPVKINFADQCFPQNHIYAWAQACNNDSLCRQYVHAFSAHDYSDDPMGGGMSTPLQWATVFKESQRFSSFKKETWQTEGGPGYNTLKTPLQIAIGGAQQFYYSMRYGNTTVFLAHVFHVNDVIQVASLKNLFRYVRPGSYRITATASPDADTVYVQPLVFKHEASGTTTIIINNKASVEKKIKVNGLAGFYDMFCTTDNAPCVWKGQVDLAGEFSLPPMSLTTLVHCPANKLPSFTVPDTLVVIKNSGTTAFDITSITDGGEGGQPVSFSAWTYPLAAQLFSGVTVSYTYPSSTGKLLLTPKTNVTGNTIILIAARDNSSALDNLYNEKIISVPAYVIPYINRPPTMNEIADQWYPAEKINTTQQIILSGVSDGNDGKQKLTLRAESSAPWIVQVSALGITAVQLVLKAEGTAVITLTLSDDGLNVGGGNGTLVRTFKVVVGSGINAIGDPLNEVVFYPNPVREKLMIENPERRYTAVEMLSMNGQVLWQKKLTGEKTEVHLPAVSSGMYLIRFTGPGGAVIRKINVE